ncbi:hypothetical protein Bca52824_083515 [Brassica carinata]|uniref:SIAH-type domain-containing protein n=1 Tax=Brassica carinata TaxID=52824 RepID=A0A8X7TTP6_BRACI|nr:hypothetical protein Bca52824_083515 [Brassica carinata]
MERDVEVIIVPCPNAKHGCTEKFSYGKEIAHERNAVSLCATVLHQTANTLACTRDLYSHYYANHKDKDLWNCFMCCFNEPQGMYVTVNCIAPSAPGVGRFSYHLSYSFGDATMTFELEEMNRIQKVSWETPEKDFMLVPYYIVGQKLRLKMSHGFPIQVSWLHACFFWLTVGIRRPRSTD